MYLQLGLREVSILSPRIGLTGEYGLLASYRSISDDNEITYPDDSSISSDRTEIKRSRFRVDSTPVRLDLSVYF